VGIMTCETHGLVGFVETCSHVAKQIDDRTLPNGHRFRILSNFFVCDDCYNSLGFERFISLATLPLEEAIMVDHSSWDAFWAAYEAVGGYSALHALQSWSVQRAHRNARAPYPRFRSARLLTGLYSAFSNPVQERLGYGMANMRLISRDARW
jgi:hypothetical protein